MSRASALKGSWCRPGRAVWPTLAAAVLWSLPSAAQDIDDEPAGDARKVKIEGVVVRPTDPLRISPRLVTVILGETRKNRRELVMALSVGAGLKASGLAARSGTHEVEMSLISQTERYGEWVRAGRLEDSVGPSGGIVVLEQALSAVEISCPREVAGGGAIVIELTGVGDAVDTWNTWLVYPTAGDGPGKGSSPDGSRYEQQVFKAGAKTGGATRLTATFNTFPADRGKLLGVCIARAESEEKRVLWVKIK